MSSSWYTFTPLRKIMLSDMVHTDRGGCKAVFLVNKLSNLGSNHEITSNLMEYNLTLDTQNWMQIANEAGPIQGWGVPPFVERGRNYWLYTSASTGLTNAQKHYLTSSELVSVIEPSGSLHVSMNLGESWTSPYIPQLVAPGMTYNSREVSVSLNNQIMAMYISQYTVDSSPLKKYSFDIN